VRKFPRSWIFLFLDLVQLFLQDKYSLSVCYNARSFVFYLPLALKLSFYYYCNDRLLTSSVVLFFRISLYGCCCKCLFSTSKEF
jgi:hypothetical protein